MIIPESLSLGLDPRSTNLFSSLEALIYNLQRNGRGHHNKGINFTRDNIISFILWFCIRHLGLLDHCEFPLIWAKGPGYYPVILRKLIFPKDLIIILAGM